MPNPEFIPPEGDKNEKTSEGISDASTLAILQQSEYAVMVETSRRHPRSIEQFSKSIMSYAAFSQRVAETMFYTLPRGGKQIIGPSIRFAECLIPCWKNCAVGTRILDAARNTVSAQGVFIDYENTIRITAEVARRITDKNGNRFNDDMIVVTGSAAASIAYRNATCKGVPRALWIPAYEEAMLTAVGKAKSIAVTREEAMHVLHGLGITDWQIFNSLGVRGLNDIQLEEVLTLRTLYAELKKGDRSIEEVFGSEYDSEIEKLFDQLKMPSAQRGMLKNEHMGRAKDLRDHLLQRLGKPAAATQTQNVETKPQDSNSPPESSSQTASESQVAPEREKATRKPRAHKPQPDTPAETKPAEAEAKPSEVKPEQQQAQPEPVERTTTAPLSDGNVPQTGRFSF